jgi:hypothetical protein
MRGCGFENSEEIDFMSTNNEVAEEEQQYSMVAPVPQAQGVVEIVGSPSVTLQTLDLARHVAIAPNGQRYVVATFNDTHMGRQYVTAIYPQQSRYLTLFRLLIKEKSSENAEQAIRQHIEWVQAIQQGKLKQILNKAEG